jgi:TolB-like protein/tetratricopeptide (TPR) repeat protein
LAERFGAPDLLRHSRAGSTVEKIIEFFKRLAGRSEVQFCTVYLGFAWLMLDLSVVLEDALDLPNWTSQMSFYALSAGLPAALFAGWLVERTQSKREEGEILEETATGQAPLHAHENPSIVVLPFRARLNDETEALTAEGLTDDITALLTGILGLKVFPRLSAGRTLAEDADPLAIARSFQADYMVTGSVRRDGKRLRVLCELTDLARSNQIWSERFDKKTDDLFSIQDDVAKGVVGALGGMIVRIEAMRATRQPPENLRAWELTRRAHEVSFDWQPTTMARGVADCRRAIELDPGYAHAHAYLGLYLSWQVVQGWTENPVANTEEALVQAELTSRLTREDAEVVSAVGEIYRLLGHHQKALQHYESAWASKPDIFTPWPFGLILVGWLYGQLGEAERGLEYVVKFESMYPSSDLGRVWSRVVRGYIELCQRHYSEAAQLHENPPSEYNGMCRVVALMCLDQTQEAANEFGRLAQSNPDISLDHYIEQFKSFHVDRAIGEEFSRGLARLKLIPLE